MNLDDFNVNLQHAPSMVNLSNTPITFLVFAPPYTTLITVTNTPRSMGIKSKHTNAFSHVIETINKNSKKKLKP
jgi:hypothetical protein